MDLVKTVKSRPVMYIESSIGQKRTMYKDFTLSFLGVNDEVNRITFISERDFLMLKRQASASTEAVKTGADRG